MSVTSSRGIFLSYRRADAAPYARLLQFQLGERFPETRIFMDLDSIEPGLDFAEVIQEAVESCAVLVALIGKQWATLADEGGHRRLDDPGDYVRFEIQTAFERGVRVIPVLVDGAQPLQTQQLPDELARLARLNALEISYGRYEYDASRLLDVIQPIVSGAPAAAATRRSLPAADTGQDPGLARRKQARTTRLLIEARRTAESMTDDGTRVTWLARVAAILVRTDPARAARIFDDAEIRARSIAAEAESNAGGRLPGFGPLADVAAAMAGTYPDRAERIAQSIPENARGSGLRINAKSGALADIAKVVAATDPDRAERLARLIPEKERVFGIYTTRYEALAGIAKAVFGTDPDRAERLLESISGEEKNQALADIATMAADTDPDRAERFAQSIANDPGRSAATLAGIARTVTATDPDRAAWLVDDAERIAYSITDNPRSRGRALAAIAKTMASADAGRAASLLAAAERIAQSLSEDDKGSALAAVAGAVAATDPGRAERIAQSISPIGSTFQNAALADIARTVAATDPGRAERITQSIMSLGGPDRDWALAGIAEVVGVADPDHAERIARSIRSDELRIRALLALAEA